MEVNRLLSDELAYELTVRGLPVKNTVAENRATLRGALRLEREGISSGVNWNVSLPIEEEINICSHKLDILATEIQNFNHSNRDNEYKRIFSRLCHVQGRLKRVTVTDNQMERSRSDLLGHCLGLIDALIGVMECTVDLGKSILDEENHEAGLILDQNNLLLPELLSTGTPKVESTQDKTNNIVRPGNANEDRSPTMFQYELNNSQVMVSSRNPLESQNSPRERVYNAQYPYERQTSTSMDNLNEFQQQTGEVFPRTVTINQTHESDGRYFRQQVPETTRNEVDEIQRRIRNLLKPSYTERNTRDPTAHRSHNQHYNLDSRIQRPSDCQANQTQSKAGPSTDYCRVTNDYSRPFAEVSRWKIQFDGQSSVTNFLERIEELRVSRGVSKEQLLTNAPELFTKEALIWFRTQHFSSWDDLTERLKETFLPYDYEFDLMEEIRKRTQGSKERVITYVAAMENLFYKLGPNIPPEWTRVKLIRRNLLPYLQTQLALSSIETIPELVRHCRAVEETIVRTQKYVPPPTNYRQLLEPELAYHKPPQAVTYGPQVSATHMDNTTKPIETTISQDTGEISVSCWNCGKTGHRFRKCTERKRIFCFRCGNAGVVANSCSKCQSKNFKQRTQ